MHKYQIRLGYTINQFEENQQHYSLLLNNLNKYNVSISDNYIDSLINNKISNRTIFIQSVQLNDIPFILNSIPINYFLIDIIVFPVQFRLPTTLYSFDSNLISNDLKIDQFEITKIANLNAEDRNKYYDENIRGNKISLNQINELKKLIAEKDIEILAKDNIIKNYKKDY